MKRYNKAFALQQDLMNLISTYMNDEIRERMHSELSPCTPVVFLKRYLKLDPDFAELLKTEFKIEM